MMSIISSLPKTLLIGTFFSKCSRAKLTLSAIEPPLSWISTMWAFFWRLLNSCCWVWQSTRTTWQYFLIWLRSFSISFFPTSSFHLRQALVKAFFLDFDLYFFRGGGKQKLQLRTKYLEHGFIKPRDFLKIDQDMSGIPFVQRFHQEPESKPERKPELAFQFGKLERQYIFHKRKLY